MSEPDVIYLDNASSAHPRPTEVVSEVGRALRETGGSPFQPAHRLARAAADVLDTVRSEAAGLLGVSEPARVVLAASGTDALNGALRGILQLGGHVITTTLEHDAVARPLTHLQMKGEISLTRVEAGREGRIDPDDIGRAIGHRTRLIVVTHGSNVLGTVQPVEEVARLAKGRGIPVLVDGSHTVGVLPIPFDSWGIDLLACSGHKGLFGPPGTGLLLVGKGRRPRAWREGESGGGVELRTHPLDLPWSLEAGMPDVAALAGLAAGIRFVQRETVARIADRLATLSRRFIGALGLDERFRLHAARGDLPRTGTVSFTLGGASPSEVARIMDERYGIAVRAGTHGAAAAHSSLGTLPGGTLRVSPGYFNTEEEIDKAVAAFREIADGGVGLTPRASRALQDSHAPVSTARTV